MRRTVLIGIALTIPTLLLAADIFSELGWEKQAFKDSCYQFALRPNQLPPFHPTPAMRAMAVLQRKTAMESLIGKAKDYYASQVFKKRWEDDHGSAADVEQGVIMGAQGAREIRVAITRWSELAGDAATPTEIKGLVSDMAAATGGSNSLNLVMLGQRNPKAALRNALQHFLIVTNGIDYSAALSINDKGIQIFTNPDYEKKPREWKMGFRAGRETTEEARALASAWVKEIK